MGQKKWNVTKKEGSEYLFDIIKTIISEKKKNEISYEELVLLMNIRTKDKDFLFNEKKKPVINYIRKNWGSLIDLIDTCEDVAILYKGDTTKIILSNVNNIVEDWIFVE
jgi:hypothetical protein